MIYYITGIANKKSIAYFVAKKLIEEGHDVISSVQNEVMIDTVNKLLPTVNVFKLDVTCDDDFKKLKNNLSQFLGENKLDGFLHSMAFGNFSEGVKPFIETSWSDFSQALNISMFSIVNILKNIHELFSDDASVVTMGISNVRALSYGYMGPIKACLHAAVPYLAKDFSKTSRIRVNAVCAGPLKTSASAGIPGYIDNYLYAEKLTLRKSALKTSEVANTITFLLSKDSSGINGECITVDAGINSNFFDEDIVKKVGE